MKVYHRLLTFVTICGIAVLGVPDSAHAEQKITKEAFGVNIHLAQRFPVEDWGVVMTASEEMGATWGREEFNWDVIEPSDGNFEWETYDAVLAAYQEHHVNMLGLLTYSSQWASPQSSAEDYRFYVPNLTAWEDYVAEVVAHYPEITAWEIWNEPNHEGFLNATPQEYAEMFVVAAEVIRTANPEATIVLGGLSGADDTYLDAVYEAVDDPEWIDVVAFHPYRNAGSNGNYMPEQATDGLNTLMTDIASIKTVVLRHDDPATPLWLTEVGWKTSSDGISQQQQAQFLMRLYTIALSVPDVAKVFWYAMVDPFTDDSEYFGLIDQDYAPKKAFTAYRFIQKQLRGLIPAQQSLLGQRLVEDFATSQGWSFYGSQCSSGVAASVGGVLRVDATFDSAQNCYGLATFDFRLREGTRMIQFRAKGTNAKTVARLRVTDATGETFQYNLSTLPSEWMTYTVRLNEFVSHWGGDNDGKLDGRLQFQSIVLDNQSNPKGEMSVFVDNVVQSGIAHGYLYQFQRGKQPIYAFWKAGNPRVITLNIPPVYKARLYDWQRPVKDVESKNARYSLRAFPAVRFLRAK